MSRPPSPALLWSACLLAAAVAWWRGAEAQPSTNAADAAVSASASAASPPLPSSAIPEDDLSPDPSPAAASSPEGTVRDRSHGRAPLPGGAMVPLKWMPPGTHASPVPSDEIFPPQTLAIRFNHKLHIKDFGQTCKVCHAAAYTSAKATDRLLPDPGTTCDNCHDVDHSDLTNVTAGDEEHGQCDFCHLGEDPGKNGTVARLIIPPPNLRMNHEAHLARNIGCAQCHGMVEELELATRDQLPRMAGCFSCHAMAGPAAGEARGHCTNCHLREPSGRLRVTFSTGALLPPMWLHGAAHTPDWLARHKMVAGANSEMCGSCHGDSFCSDCHDGRVRPRKVHPNDWISMHSQAARQDNPRCVSCHQLQTFCADCHRRVGVARDVASGNRNAGRRFHPPPAVWTLAPRSAQHHAFEAQRNLNACVACHTERDCATCHAAKGVRGGGGVNPHPAGFRAGCRAPFRRNPRPCLVCHHASDPVLSTCN